MMFFLGPKNRPIRGVPVNGTLLRELKGHFSSLAKVALRFGCAK